MFDADDSTAATLAFERPSAFDSDEPISGIRTIPEEVRRATIRDCILPETQDRHDASVIAAFRFAVAKTGAQVGLLHRRTDAFLYTTCVHQLDPGLHLCVGLSFWDAAAQQLMREKTVIGASGRSEATAAVARRLRGETGETEPRYVLAFPVVIDGCVEAVIELGRSDAPFDEGALVATTRSLVALNGES